MLNIMESESIKQFGTNYGGFYYPSNLNGLNKNSIIYCVGAGEDITHDIEIANQLNSKVYIFDPTPKAIEHVKYVKDVFDDKKLPISSNRYGGGDPNYWNVLLNNRINSDKIILKEYGLFTEDSILKFYKPSNPDYVSHSLVHGMKSDNYFMVNVKSLNSIMEELNHDAIDLLKIDIEGCECDVINKMLDDNIYPKYLSVDFDLGWHGERIADREKCLKTINRILSNNYRIIHYENSDFSFKLIN
tara:strand:- start:1118 stop:1852 length:735 start_codon:yes stop_codon:yes gene_type:complete